MAAILDLLSLWILGVALRPAVMLECRIDAISHFHPCTWPGLMPPMYPPEQMRMSHRCATLPDKDNARPQRDLNHQDRTCTRFHLTLQLRKMSCSCILNKCSGGRYMLNRQCRGLRVSNSCSMQRSNAIPQVSWGFGNPRKSQSAQHSRCAVESIDHIRGCQLTVGSSRSTGTRRRHVNDIPRSSV